MKSSSILGKIWQKSRKYASNRRVIVASVFVGAGLLAFPLISYAYYSKDISDRDRLMNRNNTGIVILDKNNEVIYSLGNVNHNGEKKLGEISDNIEKAVVASEDEEFYNHNGFSLRGMARAMYANVLNTDATRYGGSTITQQLVKNTLTGKEKTYLRKYQELSMAIAIERQYSKDEILEMYLNSVYFGEGAFGIETASKTYFNKPASDLSLAESAMLVGILPAPSAYSPVSGDKESAKKHQARVLRRMVEIGAIDQQKADLSLEEKLAYAEAPKTRQDHAQHFAIMVLQELKDKYGEEQIIRSGFKVKTGLDLEWQKKAETYVRERVDELRASGGTNASLVAIDPKTGEVRALVGSANWDDPNGGKVNATLTARQPGSSFKPIFYAEAMERKIITPATILKDKPIQYGTYRPQNYDFRFRGDVTVRRALALSMNIPAIEVMQKLGVDEAAQAARRMGISTINEPEKYGLTLGVGTAEVKLLELTNAYAALANYGSQHPVTTIKEIYNKYDESIFRHTSKPKTVLSKEASYLTSSILSDKQARAPTFNSLNIPGRTVAVKTGTTDNNHDAWTMGYTPSVVVGVWVGNNENKPMSGIAGASGAGPIWRRSITAFLGNSPAEDFIQPKGVSQIKVCQSNGLRAVNDGPGTYQEYFIKGTEPKGTCNIPAPKKEEKKEEVKTEEKEKEPPNEEERPDDETRESGGRGSGNEEPVNDEAVVEEPVQQNQPDNNPEESPTEPTSP